jgi:hypothetical protein
MTAKLTIRKLEAIAKKLRQAQESAASVELTLGNGALMDSVIGSMADEIDVLIRIKKAAASY